jgi:hypothetical protein
MKDLGDGTGTFVRIDAPVVKFLFIFICIAIKARIDGIIWEFSFGGQL